MFESRKLPPTDRDFEIYESVHIQHRSTWHMAERHHISQTRVRQIIRRVIEWLGEVIPPQTKIAKEQELRLARDIAADRFQHQLEEVASLWEETRESKYAGIRIRLTTAQARLGVVGGLAAGLAADAIEGLEVPAYVPPPEPTPARGSASDGHGREAEVAGSGNVLHPETSPISESRELSKSQIRAIQREYPWLFQIFAFCEMTPELIAAREAVGVPYPRSMLDKLYDGGYLPRPEATDRSRNTDLSELLNAAYRSLTADCDPTDTAPPSPSSSSFSLQPSSFSPPPPPGDFSASVVKSADCDATAAAQSSETTATQPTCDDDSDDANTVPQPATAPSQPLLSPHDSFPVTELQLTPSEPGATVSQLNNGDPTPSPCPLVSLSPCPRVHSQL